MKPTEPMLIKKPIKPIKGPNFILHHEDCLVGVPRRLRKGEVTLFANDPPYNINQPYADYDDDKTKQDYLAWLEVRIKVAREYLHEHGSFWIAINDDNAAELKLLCERLGFHCRAWIIWYYTFGQHHAKNFTRSKTHWFWFSKHHKKWTANTRDPKLRVPSARQLIYKDKRAEATGRVPDDFWILRPQELPEAFREFEDCWYFSRLCGTFKAKVKGMPNQMPERMMDRIIRMCSNPGELVGDLFNGTATTGVAALAAGRKYIGFDVSSGCLIESEKRLKKVKRTDEKDPQLNLFGDKPKGNSHGRRSH